MIGARYKQGEAVVAWLFNYTTRSKTYLNFRCF